MQQTSDWLRKLGMSEYAQRFAENGIDFSVLPDLTDQDFKEMGVLLGHRRKLLRAISEFNGASTPAGSSLVQPAASLIQAVGERRHLTIMFCDLVGSTSISSQLDAEEWRDLINSYLDIASAEVTKMGGHIAKKLGDGLMVLFGFPVAHENDAERAARAALGIQRALADLNTKNAGSTTPVLTARIGLEAGSVVVDEAGEIFGDAPNVAARVQSLAEPGAVLATARVQRQVAGLFVVEKRGSHSLKGIPDPVTLFQLIRASGAGHRGGHRHLTPLVGRDEEIAMLMRRWNRARDGEGQSVLVVGEPGLGKSRLIEEFYSRLREMPHTWVEWNCSPLLQNTPLHQVFEWGHQRFGGAEVPAAQRLADLENALTQVKLDPEENAPLLAPLVDVPLPDERTLRLPPEDLRHRQLAALTNWVMASARIQPLVLIVENLHWADPTTLVFLRGIVERAALAPLFVLLTARPEFRPAWGIRSHHGTISLSPLDRRQVQCMVGELAARHALSQELVNGVTERTGGVPLFVEEVTRLLLERGERGNIQMIPPTLQHSLAARLDRLGPAREVAQIGAVIGRSFSYTVVRQVSGMEDAPLQLAFERLTEADILLVEGHGPESVYRFKHSLIQDAAYDSLLKSQRQVLHRRIGEALRSNTVGAEAELLAYHFTQAGLTEAAIEWWGKAGRQSLQRSALIEAAEQLTRALNQIASLPTTPALRREEIKLQVALINPLMHVKGYAAPETKAAAERARFLIEHAEAEGELTDDPLLLFSVLYSFWVANHVAFDGDTMRALATQFLALAEERGTTVPLMMGHRLVGASLAATGDVVNSRIHFDKAIALYDTSKHRALTTHFGQDILVSAVAYRSAALWIVGYPNAALEDARHALNDAREIGQAATLLFALSLTGLTQLLCGDYGAVSAQSDQLVSLGSQKDALLRKAQGMIQQGCVSALTGNATDAIQLITAGMTEFRSTGATYFVPLYLSHLSRAYAELGQFNEAQTCINEAIKAVEITGERWWEPEIHRAAGEIALKLVDRDAAKAEEYFKRALATAREQQAKSWELRAAMSLARLWRGQGESQQAHELLVPVYGWFTEGFGTGDLRESRLLLDELTRDLSDDSANSKNGRDGPADNVLCRRKIDAALMNAIV